MIAWLHLVQAFKVGNEVFGHLIPHFDCFIHIQSFDCRLCASS